MTSTISPTGGTETKAAPPSVPSRIRGALGASGSQFIILVVFLVAIWLVFASLDGRFGTGNNMLTIISVSSVIGLVSLGQALTVISGGFDLSVSGVVPLGGILYAILTNDGWPLLPALLAVIVVGSVAGLVNGIIITRFRINPMIATLGMLSITSGLALTLSNGLQIPFDDIDAGVLAARTFLNVNNHVWLLLVLSVVLFVVLRYTSYGRRIYAVGGNREAARLAGVRVNAITASVYVLCSAFAALAGVVLASQLLTGSGTAGIDSNLQSITAVILGGAALTGGVGGVPGTLIGVLILGVLSNGMAILHVPSFYQTIATGVVLLLAVGLSQLRVLRRRKK
ncbi:ABC transporter permease [Herbiconiux daphne]|uniref:ABC transporter permease n=1 Tax=Herbiconiux daphne TaxID=2970914 RepID=A0ABT2H3I4_9MICO|nr:ABC transporter permease [Herbiconiux daphne]MCS5734496.1 ABC transporter permease [Herbiconiux daphne]